MAGPPTCDLAWGASEAETAGPGIGLAGRA